MASNATTHLLLKTNLKQLRLPAIAREYQALARDAERQNQGYLGYLQAVLAHEVAQREERQLLRRLQQARFPYDKRLEDFDFSAVPAVRVSRTVRSSNRNRSMRGRDDARR